MALSSFRVVHPASALSFQLWTTSTNSWHQSLEISSTRRLSVLPLLLGKKHSIIITTKLTTLRFCQNSEGQSCGVMWCWKPQGTRCGFNLCVAPSYGNRSVLGFGGLEWCGNYLGMRRKVKRNRIGVLVDYKLRTNYSELRVYIRKRDGDVRGCTGM